MTHEGNCVYNSWNISAMQDLELVLQFQSQSHAQTLLLVEYGVWSLSVRLFHGHKLTSETKPT